MKPHAVVALPGALACGGSSSAQSSLPRDSVNDRPIRVIDVPGYRVGIYGVFRPKTSTQVATLHETKVTGIYQILEGSGGPGEPAAVQRGHVYHSRGHAALVERHPGEKHETDLTYLIIRPDPESTIPLK